MFGYVKPNKPELKIKHYELYRSFYCGVCKAIDRRYGQMPRAMLNYDLTFFAVFFAGISGEYTLSNGRCGFKHYKKCVYAEDSIINMAADLNVILGYCKLRDNVNDEGSIKSRVGELFFRSCFTKISKNLPDIVQRTEEMYQQQLELERLECWSVDIASEPFAEYLSFIAQGVINEGISQGEEVSHLFNVLGRWIYLLDAVDDYDKDVVSGNYNVFKYSEQGIATAKNTLFLYLNEMYDAFEKLTFRDEDLRVVVENILLSGLLRKTEEILNKGKCKDGKESV